MKMPLKLISPPSQESNILMENECSTLWKNQITPIVIHWHSPLIPVYSHLLSVASRCRWSFGVFFFRKNTKHSLEFNPPTKHSQRYMSEKAIILISIPKNRIAENEKLIHLSNVP